MNKRFMGFASILAVPVVLACAGSDNQSNSDARDDPAATPAVAPAETGGGAAEGEGLFQSRGCVACHRIGGGVLVGPDLAGVTGRRSEDWIFGMIMRPDSMLRVDDTARELLGEFLTPMPNQRVTRGEAAQILAYILRQSGD